MPNPFFVLAHRGDRAHAPENTLASMRLAAEVFEKRSVPLPFRWVEYDATLTAEHNKPVVIFHDDRTAPLASGPDMALTDILFDDIHSRTVGGEPVPHLVDMVQTCDRLGLSQNVEVKVSENGAKGTPEPYDAGLSIVTARRVLGDFVTARGADDFRNTMFSSFSTPALVEIASLESRTVRGFLLHEEWPKDRGTGEKPELLARLKATKPSSLNLNHELLAGADDVKRYWDVTARAMGNPLPILCYTVNDPLRAKQLREWGVAAVFADDPGAMLDALKNGVNGPSLTSGNGPLKPL